VAGLIAAPGDRLAALVGIEQGMVDQGGEVGTVPFQNGFGWLTPNSPWFAWGAGALVGQR
jgi:hypothetical protein